MHTYLDQFQAAIFDLDGTLADSLPLWDTLNVEWCARRGLPDAGAFTRAVAPLPLPEVVEVARRMYGVTDTAEALFAEWEAMSREMYETRTAPMPDAAELVCALRRRGWRLSIATATFRSGCEAFLRANRLADAFDALCFTEEVGRDKRYPDTYLAAAEGMGVEPARCVVFEDLCANARGVRAAGMGLVLVHHPHGPDRWEDMVGQADLAVRGLGELLTAREA